MQASGNTDQPPTCIQTTTLGWSVNCTQTKHSGTEKTLSNTAPKKIAPPGYLSRSIGLVSSAARSAGVDLGAAMKNGQITAVDYAHMIHRCNSSTCALKCQHWSRS